MRDINKTCMRLRDIWCKWPELRFGQLMSNLLGDYLAQTGRDYFFTEDDELMDAFDDYMNHNSPWYRPDKEQK